MNVIDLSREAEFIARIEHLETGELARLRRGCGERDPVEGRCPWLIGIIYGVATEPVAFLVASLLAQFKTTDIHAGRHRRFGNFGATWRAAISGSTSASLPRRFSVLIDTQFDPRTGDGDFPYRLRQMVRFAVSKGIGIDWPTLLVDIAQWNHPERLTQKRWARSFFSKDSQTDSTTSNEKE